MVESISNGECYDLIFINIDMPFFNGTELGKQIGDLDSNAVVVYITSRFQYAVERASGEVVCCLLKPLEHEKIRGIIKTVAEKNSPKKPYHIVKVKNKTIKLLYSEICYIECCRKHIIYHTEDRDIDTVGTLRETYSAVKDHDFLQVHQGYIVNMEKIFDFDDSEIILDDGRRVMMSVRKKKEVFLAYAKYLRKNK